MASSQRRRTAIRAPSASRQVAFHQLLTAARKTWLQDALSTALKRVPSSIVRMQIAEHVPADAQQILAAAGIRDEHVFPTPAVLQEEPTLVGYYRLLLGAPRKGFYRAGTGMGLFASMEKKGTFSARQRAELPAFCIAMAAELANLVRQISPRITPRDVSELPLLTLGSMLQGANNVRSANKRNRTCSLRSERS